MTSFKERVRQSRELRLATIERVIEHSTLTAAAGAARLRVQGKPLTASADEAGGGARFEIPLVLPEGLESGDGRSFAQGAISRRELPLPLLWQIHTSDGHDGSVVVGRIDNLERIEGGMGNAYGEFDTGPYGQEAERLVRNKMLRFVSADLDKFEAQQLDKEIELSDDGEPIDDGKITGDKMRITKGRVMGVTLVAKPAFQEAIIRIVDDLPAEPADGTYEEEAPLVASASSLCAAVPIHPPKTWFNNPNLQGPTAITVTDDGRVFGHIASWDVDHIGMPFGTRVPSSRSRYAYFHTGVIRTEEGDDVPVGQLTLAGGHAPLSADASAAIKHYDETRSAVADVRAGEDAYGVWVSGALRPEVSPEQVRAFRASSPSGDWRAIKGNLELVAVCQVNVPGFPVTRAQVASGAVMTLVAAGAQQLAQLQSVPTTETEARLRRLELSERNRDLAKLAAIKARVQPALEKRREADVLRAAAVRDKMAPVLAARREKQAAELAAQHEALLDRTFGVEDYLTQFKSFSPEKRENLAKNKQALPDGSFPIENAGDLSRAIRACGRASDPAAARRHIVKRARALGKSDKIPASWSEGNMSLLELFIADTKATA